MSRCCHCEQPINYDHPDVLAAGRVQPGSAVGMLVVTCSRPCLRALDATGWVVAPRDDISRITHEIATGQLLSEVAFGTDESWNR